MTTPVLYPIHARHWKLYRGRAQNGQCGFEYVVGHPHKLWIPRSGREPFGIAPGKDAEAVERATEDNIPLVPTPCPPLADHTGDITVRRENHVRPVSFEIYVCLRTKSCEKISSCRIGNAIADVICRQIILS